MSDTALSPAAPAAEATGQDQARLTDDQTPQDQRQDAQQERQQEGQAGGQEGDDKPKREKTPEEREIARLRRRVDNLTRRLYQQPQREDLQPQAIERDNRQQQADSENLTLSRAELQKLIDQEAAKRAPTIKQQQDEIEHRRSVVEGLAQQWGQEKFDAYASDLDDAFGGLADASGKPKPATEAIFEADDPRALIEHLADPENSAKAQAIARMNPVQAGRAIAKLEQEIAAAKAKAKPEPSKAAAPIEPARGRGALPNSLPDPSNTKAWIAEMNRRERAGQL